MGSFSNVLVFGLFVTVVLAIKLVKEEEHQDFSKIPGIPGHDYPIYHEVPDTSFDCHNVPFHPGMYANVETGCQVSSICLIFKHFEIHFMQYIFLKRHIMFVTTDEKVIKDQSFCVQMEQFSIRNCLLVIGGTMLIVVKLFITII